MIRQSYFTNSNVIFELTDESTTTATLSYFVPPPSMVSILTPRPLGGWT